MTNIFSMLKLNVGLLLLLTACTPTMRKVKKVEQKNYVSNVWQADNGNGTYKNPILYADYSDPDVIRVRDDFYMTASSFNCSPGLPILHSKDLVNWTIVNYALKRNIPDEVFSIPQHGKGVWAPCIRFHNNEFYIYWGDPDFGVYMVKTFDALSEWSEPVLVMPGKGIIDPSPIWDDDGKAYMVTAWAASRSGINSMLTVWPLSPDGTKVIGEGKHVYDGHGGNHTIEGPKLYKKDSYYYIFAPAGGVTQGWQLALRSKDIYGPYEEKIVLAQGNTAINGPHQGAWVETQTGESWFLHFQDKGAYGRILYLEPMIWKNAWPVMGEDPDGDGCGQPVLTHKKPNVGKEWPVCTPPESDEFNADTLGLQWQWAANQSIKWYALLRGQDFLRLFAFPKNTVGDPLWKVPNLLMQKFTAPDFTATTKVKLTIEWDSWQGKQAGLIVNGNDYSYLAISKDESGYKLNQVLCTDANLGAQEKSVASVRLSGNEVYLRVHVSSPDAVCQFSYSENGTDFNLIGEVLQAKNELWIGSKVGIFCTSEPDVRKGGYADFDWFRIEK
ncbi:MAG TPA: glycoside hydrolase 43 family protein [Prolixibacteraceae bacterium]|nr:glycoside hydrolase 43 family protein [Prolixibacteraceae bacterium]